MSELQHTRRAALAIRDDQQRFDEAQTAALKQIGLGDVSQAQLDMYFAQCQRTGLDPFAKQIYMIKRGGVYSIQTSIDGFRLIATRTGVYVGSEESWHEVNGRVVTATVTVYRLVGGVRCPFSATAHIDEYGQNNQVWKQYTRRMLAKCAEALALRKAFPQELSGLYSEDEMRDEARTNKAQEAVTKAAQIVIDNAEIAHVGDDLAAVQSLDWSDFASARVAALDILHRAQDAQTQKAIIAFVQAKKEEVQNA